MHERNYGCRISDEYTYKGMRVVVMENEKLRISILADKGTDILEFLYKPYDIDFMWRSPLGVRNPSLNVPTSARSDGSFLDYYEGGWQEILPNVGIPSKYKGIEQGLHGEVSNIPWKHSITEDSMERVSVKFWVRTYRTPFYIEKELSLKGNEAVLFLKEKLVNEGEEEMELMWGHHPALGLPLLDENCVIDVLAEKMEFFRPDFAPTSRFEAGSVHPWPEAKAKDGQMIDMSKIPARSINASDMAYITGLKEGWYGLTNTKKKIGFGMRWDKDVFPCIWYWMVFGGGVGHPWFGRTYNIALEPVSSFPAGLENAVERETQLKLKPGQTIETELLAVAYDKTDRVERITKDGKIIPGKAS